MKELFANVYNVFVDVAKNMGLRKKVFFGVLQEGSESKFGDEDMHNRLDPSYENLSDGYHES